MNNSLDLRKKRHEGALNLSSGTTHREVRTKFKGGLISHLLIALLILNPTLVAFASDEVVVEDTTVVEDVIEAPKTPIETLAEVVKEDVVEGEEVPSAEIENIDSDVVETEEEIIQVEEELLDDADFTEVASESATTSIEILHATSTKSILGEVVSEDVPGDVAVLEITEENIDTTASTTELILDGTEEEMSEDVVATTTEATNNEEVQSEGADNPLTFDGVDEEVATSTNEVQTNIPFVVVGDNPTYVLLGGVYIDAGIELSNPDDGDILYDVHVDGVVVDVLQIDTRVVGTYSIGYVATDASLLYATVTRDVIVLTAEELDRIENEKFTDGEVLVNEDEEIKDVPVEVTELQEVATVSEEELRAQIRGDLETEIRQEYELRYAQQEQDTQTVQSPAPVVVEISEVQDSRLHGFSEDDCTVINENELYCSNQELLGDSVRADAFLLVSVQKDTEGDTEIFFQDGESVAQLTHNQVDDSNPFYDAERGVIVWQSLMEGRWQVMMYTEATGVIEQISVGNKNNINPHTQGGYIVWQQWGLSAWEIAFASLVEEEWVTTTVTDNAWHDVDPYIANGVVLWDSLVQDVWHVYSYQIFSGITTQVSQGRGENSGARVVILWENEEGGIEQTMQYDLATGERGVVNVPESQSGSDAPIELPSNPIPEATGTLPAVESFGTKTQTRDGDGADE